MKTFETHIFVFVIACFLALANLVASVYIYRQVSHPLKPAAGINRISSPINTDEVVDDIKTLLSKGDVRRNIYQLIADKNLFSVQRKAWHPPSLDKIKKQETVSQAQRTDVVLFGTVILGGKKGALLEFKKNKPGQRKKTVWLGETVPSGFESGMRVPSYTLVDVGKSSVVVKDKKGTEFHLDLYEGKQHIGVAPAVKQAVTVSESSKSNSASSVVAGTSGVKKAKQLLEKKQSAAHLQEQEALGNVRKVTTPFGAAYIKNNQNEKTEPKK